MYVCTIQPQMMCISSFGASSEPQEERTAVSEFGSALVAKLAVNRELYRAPNGGDGEGGEGERRLIPKINMTMQSPIEITVSGTAIRVNG